MADPAEDSAEDSAPRNPDLPIPRRSSLADKLSCSLTSKYLSHLNTGKGQATESMNQLTTTREPKPAGKARARRKGGSRSRSGCGICKCVSSSPSLRYRETNKWYRARHVKCDEARPSCLRCTETGRRCDGYGALTSQGSAPSSSSQLRIASYAIPFQVPGSQKDRQMLHYFCVQGAADLSGHLPSKFWTRLVLQRSHDEPAVRHAVVTLSSMHMDHTTSGDACSRGSHEDPGVLYNRALRSLRRYLNGGKNSHPERQPSPTVPLVCCVLFYCFEGARGNLDAALQHLRSGVMILNGQKATALHKTVIDSADQEDMDVLEQVLYRLDLQATMFDDKRTPLLQATPQDTVPPGGGFSTPDEAQAALTKLQNWLCRFLIANEKCKFWPAEELPRSVAEEKLGACPCLHMGGTRDSAFSRRSSDSEVYLLRQSLSKQTAVPRIGRQQPTTPGMATLRIHYLFTPPHAGLKSSPGPNCLQPVQLGRRVQAKPRGSRLYSRTRRVDTCR